MIHQKELQSYNGSLTELAEELGNLRYDALAEFLSALSEKIQRDGEKDQERNRIQLASSLRNCGKDLASSAENMNRLGKSAGSLSGVIWRDCNVFCKTCSRTNGSGSFKSYTEFVSCTIKFPKRRKKCCPDLLRDTKLIQERIMISVKGRYENGKIELNQHPEIQSGRDVIVTFLEEKLDEDSFWDLLNLIDWNQETDSGILSHLLDRLASLSPENICQFKEILSEKLFHLDTKEHARHIGEDSYKENPSSFSPDIFLFTRALVVAKGKEFYNRVLSNPVLMPKNSDFEAILYLASEAYKIKTGKEMNYVPRYIPETFSNSKGWDGDFDLKKMIFGEK